MYIILGVLLCVLAGIAKGVQDTLAHYFDISVFNDPNKFNPAFWNPKKSSINKWDYTTGVKKEKFFGSSTFLVSFTDGWHLAQLAHLNPLILGVFIIGYNESFYGLVIGVLLYRVVFEICHRWIFKT